MRMHTTMLNIQYVTHGIQLHAQYSYRRVPHNLRNQCIRIAL